MKTNSTQTESRALPVAAHTPGPWAFRTDGFDNHSVIIPCEPGDAMQSSSVALHLGYTSECEANARLIAAAPELLATLETMMERLSIAATDDHVESCKQFYNYSTVVTEARAAIAKAKGQA